MKYVWVYVTSSKAIRPRLTNYVSFGITGTLVGLATRRPDVIFASSPPLPVGGAGLAVAARHRRPWVLDVRDLWPDAAVALGQVEEGPLVSAARRFEGRLYRSAAAIAVTTEPTRQLIEGRGKVALSASPFTACRAGALPTELSAPRIGNGSSRVATREGLRDGRGLHLDRRRGLQQRGGARPLEAPSKPDVVVESSPRSLTLT